LRHLHWRSLPALLSWWRFARRRSWLTLRCKPPIAARSDRTSPSQIRHHFGNALAILRSDCDQHRCSRRPIPIGLKFSAEAGYYPDEAVVVPAEGARHHRTLRCNPHCASRDCANRARYTCALSEADQAAPHPPTGRIPPGHKPKLRQQLRNLKRTRLGVLFCGNSESYTRPALLLLNRGFFDTRLHRSVSQ
jgi:hypothetical protein